MKKTADDQTPGPAGIMARAPRGFRRRQAQSLRNPRASRCRQLGEVHRPTCPLSAYQRWSRWAANGIVAVKPSYRRLASNGALPRGPPVNSPSRLRARLRPNYRSIVESSDSSGKLFNELACPAFKQCRSGGSWPSRTSRVAPRMLLLNGRVFRTAGTAHLSAVPPSAVAAPAPMAGVTRTSEL